MDQSTGGRDRPGAGAGPVADLYAEGVEIAASAAERAAGRIVGEGKDAVPELVRLLKEEAKVL